MVIVDVTKEGVEGGVEFDGEERGEGGGREAHVTGGEGGEVGGGGDEEGEAVGGGARRGGEDGEGEAAGEGGGGVCLRVKKTDGVDEESSSDGRRGAFGVLGGEGDGVAGEEGVTVEGEVIRGGEGSEQRKIAWVKWETICLPKQKGGLGIKDTRTFNKALLGKWRWYLFHQSKELWARILASKYGG